ncbi:MAG: copper chaperone PCu(A)C [Burkholderiaceae bacterium]|nr:MAG: copper chaperone PCu(A)C [Burkholderiaceae bacterium]
MRAFLAFLGLLFALLPAAWGHASLIATTPPTGAVLGRAPQSITLTFSEPVGVTVMRLVGPDGKPLTLGPVADVGHQVRIRLPAAKTHGTYLLSWRIVSADGHPVGGTLAYAVGAASAHAPNSQATDSTARDVAIWLSRWLTYLGLFVCVGAALFRTMRGNDPQRWTRPVFTATWVLLVIDLGLQGLDLLDAPWSAVWQPAIWSAAIASTYAWTIGLMALALLAAAAALGAPSRVRRISGAALALLLSGAAVAASGHVGTAPPQWLSRPLVALHVMLAIAWIGALVPLLRLCVSPATEAGARTPLATFSKWIVPVVVVLAASGLGLALLQLEHLSDLWATNYGRVLSVKLLTIAALLCVAAINRWRYTRPTLAGDRLMQAKLARTTRAEVLLGILILAIVSLWRLTPPPRSLDARPAEAMALAFTLHDSRASARISEQAAGTEWAIALAQPDGQPFAAKQVTLTLENPSAGIEALSNQAQPQSPGHWLAKLPPLPPIGGWNARLTVLIDDFDQLTLGEQPTAGAGGADMDMDGMAHESGSAAGPRGEHAPASPQGISQTPAAKTLAISACWIRLLPAQIPSAAYFVIKNTGSEAVQIDAAASPAFASVMLHRTTEQNGVSRMSASGDLTIPPGGELAFKPGGYHAMLEQPTGPLAVGQTVTLEFLTANAEHASAACKVEPATAIGD